MARVYLFGRIAASEAFAISGFAHFYVHAAHPSAQSSATAIVAVSQSHDSLPQE